MNPNPLQNFPIVFTDSQGRLMPEVQVNSGIDEYDGFEILGDPVEITAGFIKPTGHGYKSSTSYAIFDNDPNTIQTVAPGNYNIGIDYDVNTPDEATKAWYSGEVIQTGIEGDYGNRVRIKTDITYEFQGKEYDVYTAYAHLDSIDVQVGDKVKQGDAIGEMGGTGSGGVPNAYPEHVDLQTWIELDDGRKVNISPNLLQKQLAEKSCHQYGPPTLEVIEKQKNLPPGAFDFWSGGCSTPPAPYAEDAEDGFDEAEAQVWQPPSCPLILDLDGDGIELTSLEDSTVHFDIDGDGFREATGWLQSDDGLLVLDRNNDGYINDISELFGNQTTGGFTELQVLDSRNPCKLQHHL